MNTRDNAEREKWLMEAIAGLEQVICTGELSGRADAFQRMLREYHDEYKALKEKKPLFVWDD